MARNAAGPAVQCPMAKRTKVEHSTLSEPGGEPTTVVIVDDHSAIRIGLTAALQDAGEFKVVGEAADADQAIELVRATAPDIAIVDISLPGRSGIEAAREIRSISPSTRIVAYTMHAEPGFIAGMAKEGVSVYVLKGEPLANLLEALRLARAGASRVPDPLVSATSTFGEATFADDAAEKVQSLSRREREVFLILADGQSVKQAAFELHLSPKTVETYKYRLMKKLNAENAVDLAKIALRSRLLEP